MQEIKILQTGILGVNTLIVPVSSFKVFIVDPAACALSGDQNVIVDFLKGSNGTTWAAEGGTAGGSGEAGVAGEDCQPELSGRKLEVAGILLTHSHFDHVMGLAPLRAAFPDAKIAVGREEFADMQNPPSSMNRGVILGFGGGRILDEVAKQPPADLALKDGDNYFGWKVISTPGHTPGSICLYNSERKELISGDTLFAYGGYGRTDMPGGDEIKMRHSLVKLKNMIPAGTHVFPGHDGDFVIGH